MYGAPSSYVESFEGRWKTPDHGAPIGEIPSELRDRKWHGFRLSCRHGGALMHSKLLAAAGVASLLLFTPAGADASCCDQTKMAGHDMKAGCCDMPCCVNKEKAASEEIDILAMLPVEKDRQLLPVSPALQKTEVWFQRPVWVNGHILQGRYVIEHDNDRMARGEPCTHIYAYDNQKEPVVRFHCTHLERDRASQNIAVLATVLDGSMQKLMEIQFAGETASHGVPER
jgi:hypothetical protein